MLTMWMLGTKLRSSSKSSLFFKPLKNLFWTTFFNRNAIIVAKLKFFPSNLKLHVQAWLDWAIIPPGFLLHFSLHQDYIWISINTVFAKQGYLFIPELKTQRPAMQISVSLWLSTSTEWVPDQKNILPLIQSLKIKPDNFAWSGWCYIPTIWEAELWFTDLTFELVYIHKLRLIPPWWTKQTWIFWYLWATPTPTQDRVELGPCIRLQFCFHSLRLPGRLTAGRSTGPQ